MKKMEKIKNIWQVLLAGVLLLFAAALLFAARKVPGFAEWYSSTVYPVLVTGIGGLMGLFPVSVVELLLYAGLIFVIFLLIKYRRKPVRLLMNYGLIFSALLFLYAACCGVNYYRIPFSTYYIQTMQERFLTGQETTLQPVSLSELCAWLTEEVNRAYDDLANSEDNYESLQPWSFWLMCIRRSLGIIRSQNRSWYQRFSPCSSAAACIHRSPLRQTTTMIWSHTTFRTQSAMKCPTCAALCGRMRRILSGIWLAFSLRMQISGSADTCLDGSTREMRWRK